MKGPHDPKRAGQVRTAPTKVRGSYVAQACAFCRRRKTRCDGKKPVCTPCETSGHECTWGAESAKRPSTKQYVESLRNRIRVLEGQVQTLESTLTANNIALPPGTGLGSPGIFSVPASTLTSPITAKSGGGPNGDYLNLGGTFPAPPGLAKKEDSDDGNGSVHEDEDIEQLCAPTEQLVLEEDDLQMYGPTSAFRLAPKYLEHTDSHPHRPADGEGVDKRIKLIVPGVEDVQNANDGVDWSRHLPREIPLTRIEHDRVLDLLFKFFTSWCMRIVPSLFLRDMHRSLSVPPSAPPPKTPHYSPMLHNALVALAAAFSDDPHVRSPASRNRYARKAKGYIEGECARPNISVVHALAMLASYHSSQGDQTLGYMYFGMSGRMSQALGLNVDCSPWVKGGLITKDDMHDRNWAHWTTFCNDVLWSLYVGRDLSVAPAEMPKIPIPAADEELDREAWVHPPSGLAPQPGYLSETFVETCQLMVIARRIMGVVNELTSPEKRHQCNFTLISMIDVELNTWKERLSPQVDITLSSRPTALPHRITLHLSYWWLFILMHRPFYRRAKTAHGAEKDIDHVKLCNRAAENIMELIGTWRTLYDLRYAPVTLIQVVFSAGTIFLLSAVHATSGARLAHVSLSHALAQAELCIQYLGEVGEAWQAANNIAGILGNLLQEQLKPRLVMRSVDPLLIGGAVSAENGHTGRERSRSELARCALELPSKSAAELALDLESFGALPPVETPTVDGALLHSIQQDAVMSSAFESAWREHAFGCLGADGQMGPSTPMDVGFPGMGYGTPGGETLPNIPFMSFGLPPQHNGNGFMPRAVQPSAPFALTEEDLGVLQQFLSQQQQQQGTVRI